MLRFLRRLGKTPYLAPLFGAYHFVLAYLGAALYGFPSERITLIGVTGTKGKTSTTEYLSAIFERAGKRTALVNSIRFKVGERSEPNTDRMSMPGRFFLQSFLAKALEEGCEVAIIEMTSEGARQHRHRFLDLDAFLFLNLAPEHIESHGSFEKYADAKYELARQLLRSKKRPRFMVANADDAQSARYLTLPVEFPLPFSLSTCEPFSAGDDGGSFHFGNTDMHVHLPGVFSLENALAAAAIARAFGIEESVIREGLDSVVRIPGRAEEICEGQDFLVVVDYAHTPDSLTALYDAYKGRRSICVLGATGGGRDIWKRPVMGEIAERMCEHVILTNEDPYDEDPRSIIEQLARNMKKNPDIVLDRREAIARALSLARSGDAVLITGKGTDPTIQGRRGTATPWSDAGVAREELRKHLGGAASGGVQ